MKNYCILKQPGNPNVKTKIRVIPQKKLVKLMNRRNSDDDNEQDKTSQLNLKFDIVKVRRNEKDSLLFAFDSAFKSFEELVN